MQEYFIGLDMGTSSCGWAVTDTNYKLLRAKGKDMWGVRLFSEANTSADRRMHRTSRRRLEREKIRIGYLRELFSDEINKVDPGFFPRLDTSKYIKENDADEKQPILFADKNYKDKDYYQEYPTIFHLRKALIENSEKEFDIRLIYLAISNMFHHRGHFLNENLDSGDIGNLSELYSSLLVSGKEQRHLELPNLQDTVLLEEILGSKKYSNTGKSEQIAKLLNINKKMKPQYEMIRLICGLSVTVSNIFCLDNFDDETKKLKVSFRDANYDEKNDVLESLLSEESYEIFMILKQIHDWSILANIMKGENGVYPYLSYARVDSYNKHKKDLDILKKLYKNYAPKEYDNMFRIMKEHNYSAYVGSVNSGKETEKSGASVIRRGSKCKVEDFYKGIKKTLEKMPPDENVQYVLEEIQKETFLPKQLNASNGVIPNQVHKKELIKILKNAETSHEFLKMVDETGLSVSEKIIALFEFQIPYYVGPLFNANKKGNGWAVRKENGKVLPWNFEQKIDVKESAERFIQKMVNHCTYLGNETVLPKNSLLYEKYRVLNEINTLKINGERIDVSLKQNLYKEFCRKGKRLNKKIICTYLKQNGYFESNADIEILGVDDVLANTCSNYKKFTEIFGNPVLTYDQETMAENIIFWSTVYGDSKKFVRDKIELEYGNILTQAQIKRILGMKFKDWGRLSKEFLQLEGADVETGEIMTIMSRMWNSNENLNELLSRRFTYLQSIEEKSLKLTHTLQEMIYEDLDGLYISAPVKRMVWQTIMILKEINQIMGREPKRIFVEMARNNETDKKRTVSRKNKFAELYKGYKEGERNWANEIGNLSEEEFRSKKMYLYYTQRGRCMYTGEIIELDDLRRDNLYDIDHIYPRHFVKDDSLENNLVLVKKEKNAHKSDVYPIEDSIRASRHMWWKSLKDSGLITEEKYKRLTRNYEFSNEELADFVNRQLVETRQGTKVITDLLKNSFSDTEIVYVKAANVSDFRRHIKYLKCRDVNDFHHAQDAYLNIVVGNTYHIKFTKNPLNFVENSKKYPNKYPYHMDKIFEYTVKNKNEIAWNTRNNESYDTVKRVMKKNTPIVTKMNYEEHGAIADQTIYGSDEAKKAKGQGYLPIKKGLEDTTKYGGYKKITGSYFFVVEHTVKGKRIKSFEPVFLYMKDRLDSNEKIEQYCSETLGYIEPRVVCQKIKMYSLIKVNGFYMYLTGRTGTQLLVCNAVQMVLKNDDIQYIKNLKKSIENKNALMSEITQEKNIALYDVLTDKHLNSIYKKRPNSIGDKLKESREKFIKLSVQQQRDVLLQILEISKLSNSGCDLTVLGYSKKTGVSLISKKITEEIKEFKIIHQSVTGLYQQEVDILAL